MDNMTSRSLIELLAVVGSNASKICPNRNVRCSADPMVADARFSCDRPVMRSATPSATKVVGKCEKASSVSNRIKFACLSPQCV